MTLYNAGWKVPYIWGARVVLWVAIKLLVAGMVSYFTVHPYLPMVLFIAGQPVYYRFLRMPAPRDDRTTGRPRARTPHHSKGFSCVDTTSCLPVWCCCCC